MDAERFDDVIRSLTASPSRRTVLGLTLVGTLGSLLGLADADAKGKKHKKKKKKCKGATKKCGKKCIPATSCCTAADCGGGGATCQNGACLCPSGQKDCQGTCIPDDDCCTDADCGGDLTCDDGSCLCPGDAFPCGNVCVTGDQCCDAADCGGSLICDDGFCLCPGPSDIECNGTSLECCDSAADEVCEVNVGCQSGGCPETDFCIDTEFFICADGCVCTTTVDPVATNACVDALSLDSPDCTTCTTSANCDSGEVCIASGEFCGEECGAAFCVPLCGEGLLGSAGRSESPSLKDVSAANGSGGKQRQRKRGGRKHRR